MRAAQKEYGGVVAAQRPRSAAPPKPTKDQQRLKELEGAIVQAKEDYVQVLKGTAPPVHMSSLHIGRCFVCLRRLRTA